AGGTLPVGPGEPSDLVGLWREAAAEYLNGVFDGPAASELRRRYPAAPRAPPAIVFRRLNRPIADRRMGLSADAGHRFGRDGTLHVYANDPAGVLHELVEALFAPWAGFTHQQAHTIAVLAERAVADPAHRDGELLTARARHELDTLVADGRADVLTVLAAEYEQVRDHLLDVFAGQRRWRPVVMRYASEFHSAVVAAQREVVEEHERHRRRARWHGYAFSVRHRLKAAVDAHSAAVDRALDAYEAAVRDLRGTVERWDGRFEWASFTV